MLRARLALYSRCKIVYTLSEQGGKPRLFESDNWPGRMKKWDLSGKSPRLVLACEDGRVWRAWTGAGGIRYAEFYGSDDAAMIVTATSEILRPLMDTQVLYYSRSQLAPVPLPAIFSVSPAHFIVVFKRRGTDYYIVNPPYSVMKVSGAEIRATWSGYVMGLHR